MKRVLTLLLCALLLAGTVPAGAATIAGEEISSLPQGWTVTTAPDASHASAEMTGGVLTLGLDTMDGTAFAASQVTTSAYDLSAGALYMELDFRTERQEGSGDAAQYVTLMDGVGSHNAELFSIEQGRLTPFLQEGEAVACGNGAHSVTLVLDPMAAPVKAALWLDGALVYSGAPGRWNSGFDMAALQIRFASNVVEASLEHQWEITELTAANLPQGAYSLTSIPADGATMVSPAEIMGIALDFGTYVGPGSRQASNFTLTSQDGPVDFTVQGDARHVTLTPTDGLQDRSEYTLTVKEVTDLYGQTLASEETIHFTTAYPAYAPPVITPDFEEGLTLYQGQRGPLGFTSDRELERMEIYVDGSLKATLNQAPYTYYFYGETPGTAEIQAVGYDPDGGAGYSPLRSLRIQANQPPTITITGIADGGSYGDDSLPQVTISAQDENGVASLSLAVDDSEFRTVQGDTMTFSLGEIPGGTHRLTATAQDLYGLTAQESLTVTLTASQSMVTYENDFSDYTGNDTLPREMVGGPQRGYLDVGEIDEAHGKSLLIGIEKANETYNTDNTAYVGIPTGPVRGAARVEMDIYFSALPAQANPVNRYRMSMKQSDGAELQVCYFRPDGLEIVGVSGLIPYEAGRWYHFTLLSNIADRSFEVTLTDSATGAENKVRREDFVNTFTKMDYLRFFGPHSDLVPGYVAVDNVKVSRFYALPELTFQEPVDAAAPVVVTASSALDPQDYLPENFLLTSEYGPAAVASVSGTETEITLTPAEPLRTNTLYTLTIQPGVRFSGGPAMGLAVQGSFRTAPAPTEILEGRYETDGTGTKFILRAANEGTADIRAMVVFQVWADGVIQESQAVPLTLKGGSADQTYTLDAPSPGPGEEITAYIWDGLADPTPISPRIFRNN